MRPRAIGPIRSNVPAVAPLVAPIRALFRRSRLNRREGRGHVERGDRRRQEQCQKNSSPHASSLVDIGAAAVGRHAAAAATKP
jgi:hypothetical protein